MVNLRSLIKYQIFYNGLGKWRILMGKKKFRTFNLAVPISSELILQFGSTRNYILAILKSTCTLRVIFWSNSSKQAFGSGKIYITQSFFWWVNYLKLKMQFKYSLYFGRIFQIIIDSNHLPKYFCTQFQKIWLCDSEIRSKDGQNCLPNASK